MATPAQHPLESLAEAAGLLPLPDLAERLGTTPEALQPHLRGVHRMHLAGCWRYRLSDVQLHLSRRAELLRAVGL